MNHTTPRIGGELSLLFIAAYLSHGIASQFGVIAQPVQYYLKDALHMTAAQVSSCLAIMMLPWVLKPFFGILCDSVPLAGYRRKSYIVSANILTAVAFLVMCLASHLWLVIAAFATAALAVAASTAVTVGVAVEAGRDQHSTRSYFSLQTICYYAALIVASLAGGWLCRSLSPVDALKVAAAIAIVPPLIVASVCAATMREVRSKLDLAHLRTAAAAMKTAFTNKPFWLAAAFIWLWDFSPSFGVPLYFHESNNLHFSQGLIGTLTALTSVGMLLGAITYRFTLQKCSLKLQLYTVVALGVASTLGYLLLSTPSSAVALELVRGFTNMLAILAIYALAADVCPPGAEVSAMAALIAVRNIGLEGSTYIGGQLFTHGFGNRLMPLILVAAATTALCAVLIPFVIKRQPQTGS